MRISIWLLLLAGACARPETPEEDAAVPSEPVPVKVVTLARGQLHPTLTLLGKLVAIPEDSSVVAARVTGQVAEILVVPGQLVEARAVIARIDERLLAAESARARSTVAERAAKLAILRLGTRPEEIEVAQQRTRQREATAELLHTKLTAIEELARHQEVSPVTLAAARGAVQEAEAMAAAARAEAALARAGPRKETVTAASASLDAASAELDAAELRLEFAAIRSPVAGIVTRVLVFRGTNAQPDTAIAEVRNLSRLFARVRVPATMRDRVRSGARAVVHPTGVDGGGIAGVLTRIVPRAAAGTSAVEASVRVENLDGHLVPGLACRVILSLPVIEDTILIPVTAVAERSGASVVTQVRDGHAYEVAVRLGIRGQEGIQIIAGLAAGDVVITAGGYALPEGCPVRASR
jgi:multidrug efflux pump subunit AcrA (membrane-fusion protein)